MTDTTPELSTLKARLKATWSDGDYGVVAENLQKSAGDFLARYPIEPGTRVLDVACGTGQVAFPAAAAGARVTGIDIAPNLIAQARARAEAEGVDIRFDEGDAEALPYADASFDLVITLIGAMFAPRPDRVASELTRVCRPGGHIVMANWTPEGFVGSMFKTVGKHVPPSPLMPSPLQWGVEDIVRHRLKDGITDLRLTKRLYDFDYPFAPSRVVEFFRTYFGPVKQAFAALDEDGQAALHEDLERLWATHNRSGNGRTHLGAEFLEVVAVRG
jgi:SAM-dependent methyltransferase